MSSKKAKMTNETKEEIQTLKQYILQCPSVDQSSVAIQTCITALNNELTRMDRDEKLRMKFANENVTAAATTNNTNNDNGDTFGNPMKDMEGEDEDDVVCVDMDTDVIRGAGDCSSDIDITSTDEWQDVTSSPPKNSHKEGPNRTIADNGCCALGISLAQSVIADISNSNVLVSSPLAALALALHAMLRSDILGFKCTGIPEEELNLKNDGFAPPVRELPKEKFLPNEWDKFASSHSSSTKPGKVTLRYRKNGTGATILRLLEYNSLEDNNISMVKISFGPAGNNSFGGVGGCGEPWEMNVPINRHVNVDGLNAAIDKSNKVKPALHYLSLPTLLSEFCKHADLGTVKEDKAVVPDAVPVPVNARNEYQMYPNISDEFQTTNRNSMRMPGDFSGDLLPSGIPAPGFANPNPSRFGRGIGGNLMGINDPYFQGGTSNDYNEYDDRDGTTIPRIGGLGMQPRFDPYYPPGVSGRGRGGRGGRNGRGSRNYSGDPNPDHLRPPSNLGRGDDNMFM